MAGRGRRLRRARRLALRADVRLRARIPRVPHPDHPRALPEITNHRGTETLSCRFDGAPRSGVIDRFDRGDEPRPESIRFVATVASVDRLACSAGHTVESIDRLRSRDLLGVSVSLW